MNKTYLPAVFWILIAICISILIPGFGVFVVVGALLTVGWEIIKWSARRNVNGRRRV